MAGAPATAPRYFAPPESRRARSARACRRGCGLQGRPRDSRPGTGRRRITRPRRAAPGAGGCTSRWMCAMTWPRTPGHSKPRATSRASASVGTPQKPRPNTQVPARIPTTTRPESLLQPVVITTCRGASRVMCRRCSRAEAVPRSMPGRGSQPAATLPSQARRRRPRFRRGSPSGSARSYAAAAAPSRTQGAWEGPRARQASPLPVKAASFAPIMFIWRSRACPPGGPATPSLCCTRWPASTPPSARRSGSSSSTPPPPSSTTSGAR
mmetsp:Transcript_31899/g.98726  ORF Transcript_31899/g.98726 Transcript_31899/m.98726 type:complete len:267 (+) Transcript_31899:397-1197(+)